MGMSRCYHCGGSGHERCRKCDGSGVQRLPASFVIFRNAETAVDNRIAEIRRTEQNPPACSTCGLLVAMPGRKECVICILQIRDGGKDNDEAPGIGDS